MKKIRMKTLAAGSDGVLFPDKVYNLPDPQAQALIDGGYAVEAEKSAKAVPPQTAPEPEKPEKPKRSGREKATAGGREKAVEED